MQLHNNELLEMIKDCVIESLIKGEKISDSKMELVHKIGEGFIREIPNIVKNKFENDKENLRTYEAAMHSFEKLIIQMKCPRYIYWFATTVRGYSTLELEEAIIKTQDARHIYLYARDVEGASVTKLQNAIISTRNAQHIYLFNKYVKGANEDKIFKGLLKTGDLRNITLFLNDIIEKRNLSEEDVYKYLYEGITAFENS